MDNNQINLTMEVPTCEEVDKFIKSKYPDIQCPVCHYRNFEASPYNNAHPHTKNLPHDTLKLEVAHVDVPGYKFDTWKPLNPNEPTPMFRFKCVHCGYIMFFDFYTIVHGMKNGR